MTFAHASGVRILCPGAQTLDYNEADLRYG